MMYNLSPYRKTNPETASGAAFGRVRSQKRYLFTAKFAKNFREVRRENSIGDINFAPLAISLCSLRLNKYLRLAAAVSTDRRGLSSKQSKQSQESQFKPN
jgi:hypothetical protein